MAKVDKPKTPESERLQAKQASDNFKQGNEIKLRHSAATRGDMRYDASSAMEAASSGMAAVRQKAVLKDSRKKGEIKYAGDSFDVSQVRGMAESSTGGADSKRVGDTINRGSSQILQIGNMMSKLDSDKAIDKMEESNSKRQAAMDVATGITQAYALSTIGSGTDPMANATQDTPDYHNAYDASVMPISSSRMS